MEGERMTWLGTESVAPLEFGVPDGFPKSRGEYDSVFL
jgi:hypothetical protein